jgi:threonine synthase
MDIQISSNFERYLFDLLGRDAEKLKTVMDEFKSTGRFAMDDAIMKKARAEFHAFRSDEETTLATMQDVFKKTDYVLDPHTAVGHAAARELQKKSGGIVINLATAHPSKFPDAVEKATGQRPALPSHLADLFEREERFKSEVNDLSVIQQYIRALSMPVAS